MDGLGSLLFAAALVAPFAAFGFWAWRRSARPAVVDVRSGALALQGFIARSKESVPTQHSRSDPELRDVQGGCPRNGPPDDIDGSEIFSGEAVAPLPSPEIVLPASQQQPVGDEVLRESIREHAGTEDPAAPPAVASLPSNGQAQNPLPHDGSAIAEAENEEPADGLAAPAPLGPLASESQLEPEAALQLPIASNPVVPDIAIADVPESRPADALDDIESIAASPADGAQVDVLADRFATHVALTPLPAKSQGQGDVCAGRGDQAIDPRNPDNGLEIAAAADDDEQGETDAEPPPAGSASEEPVTPSGLRPIQPAIHRDRRGGRRAPTSVKAPSTALRVAPSPAARSPAEAKLRLSLHPIRRTARLSVVLARPDGFPQRVTLDIDGKPLIEAYDVQRYDDLDLPWTGELLEGELRVASAEGFRWLRSARQVHIFAEDPSEPGLITVGAARPGLVHTLICRSGDAAAVCAASASTGSPEPTDQKRWQGIPEGWTVLSGYTPVHAAAHPLAAGLRPLDPGAGIEIEFEGGLAVRLRVFAQGHPPRIAISPEPVSASVTIGGQPAARATGGGWEAPGWDMPGHHLVDVVPGPSAAYEIAADPSGEAGWEFWNAHAGRFGDLAEGPWARAEICGASIRGPTGQVIFAVETQPTLIALGARSSAVPLTRRLDVSVSVGFVPEPPAFLFSATRRRRSQGRVIWLGLTPAALSSKCPDPDWVATVRAAASSRLPLQGADALGEDAWRKAKEQARRPRRPRR